MDHIYKNKQKITLCNKTVIPNLEQTWWISQEDVCFDCIGICALIDPEVLYQDKKYDGLYYVKSQSNYSFIYIDEL